MSRREGTGQPGRSGMAVPVVIAALVVVGTFLLAFGRYQASRVRATGDQVNSYGALEAAQAGLHVALAEMRLTPGWVTHRLELDAATGAFRWTAPVARPLATSGDPTATGGMAIDETRSGIVSGTVGTGVFQARFKVRVGRIPLSDDPSTGAVDEASRFYRIEVVAQRNDPARRQDRATRLDLIVERSDFTEFVVYDGDDIILGMGSYHDRDNINLVADGSLFGKNFVHMGNIAHSGTRQAFVNLGRISSDGPIKTWSEFDIGFQDPTGTRVRFHPGNDSRAGDSMETAHGNILDGNHRKAASAPILDREFYRRKAHDGGIDVSNRPAREDTISLYPEAPKIHLDFGRAGYLDAQGRPTSGIPPDDARALGVEYPPDFNGLIYSEKPLAVWGAPDRDVTIFCTEDVYVCGDFNQRNSWRKTADGRMDWVGQRQNYKPRYEPPGAAPVDGTRFFEYRERDREVYASPTDPGQRILDGTEERKACAIISLGRVWYDARHPSRYLANELRPYVKYKIVEAVAGERAAYEYVKDGSSPRPVTDLALRNRGTLGPGLADLFDVRRKVTDTQPRRRLYLSPQTFEKVSRAFEDILVRQAATEDERGVITREKLEGAPGKPGLVDAVMEALIEDEPRHGEFPGAQGEPPALGIWNAPQGLYDLVYDERGSLGPQGYGPYSDWSGDPARQEFADDELFMPQLTINAMIFTSAARNDPTRSVDPTDMNRRFDDLGNGPIGVHFLSTQAYRQGDTENIMSPIIQRVMGAEVRLATVKHRPPQLGNGYYWPSIRRRIYDRSLPFHPPPLIPNRIEIVSFKHRGATPPEFARFDSSR